MWRKIRIQRTIAEDTAISTWGIKYWINGMKIKGKDISNKDYEICTKKNSPKVGIGSLICR